MAQLALKWQKTRRSERANLLFPSPEGERACDWLGVWRDPARHLWERGIFALGSEGSRVRRVLAYAANSNADGETSHPIQASLENATNSVKGSIKEEGEL